MDKTVLPLYWLTEINAYFETAENTEIYCTLFLLKLKGDPTKEAPKTSFDKIKDGIKKYLKEMCSCFCTLFLNPFIKNDI